MLKGNREKGETKRKIAEKTAAAKEWIVFFGELMKASVDGVTEFWSKEEKSEAVVQQPTEEPVEEVAPDEEDDDVVVEDEEELDPESETEEETVSAKELRKQAKQMKKMARRVRKEEHRAHKAERKLKKLEKKTAKADKKQEKKQAKDEKKEANRQEKARKKSGYVSKNMILSETEKKFFDGLKSAVGLRYLVKPRVALADVLKRGDGSKCKDEQLGEMDFGVFDLQYRLKVLVEIKGMKRRGKQSQKNYKKVRKLCKKAGIPVVTFWAKYGVLPDYIKERMQDYLNL